jgi:PmbA protein
MALSIDQAQTLLEEAKTMGAMGDILAVQGESFEITVRMREIEKVSEARSHHLTLRLFFGQRHAITSTSDLSPASLKALLADTCRLALIAPEDPYAGLPDPADCTKTIPLLDLFDSEVERREIGEKIDLVKRAEEAALSFDPRIKNSDGASIGHGQVTILYATTNGFSGRYTRSSASLSVVPVAEEEGKMQRDYWYSSRIKYRDLDDPVRVGQIAAQRTIRRLGARQVATCQAPVILDPENAASLLSHLASALSGYALYKNASFLTGKLGAKIASDIVAIIDDPTLPGGLGSAPFDGEGLPARRKQVVEKGVLQSYLLDTYSGKKLGLKSTGNGSRSSGSGPGVGVANFHLLPGTDTPEAIIRSVQSGLYVTDLIGFGVNTVTGDYSQGASGFWIENGELAYPVEEITIAGNLKEMLLNIEQVGNDLDPWKRVAAPTIKIAQMTIAGGERRSE